MFSSATPFKIHDENQHVMFKSTTKKSLQNNVTIFADPSTPLKPGLKSTVKSTRKVLGDVSNAQANLRNTSKTPLHKPHFIITTDTIKPKSKEPTTSNTIKMSEVKQAAPVLRKDVRNIPFEDSDLHCTRRNGLDSIYNQDPGDWVEQRAKLFKYSLNIHSQNIDDSSVQANDSIALEDDESLLFPEGKQFKLYSSMII